MNFIKFLLRKTQKIRCNLACFITGDIGIISNVTIIGKIETKAPLYLAGSVTLIGVDLDNRPKTTGFEIIRTSELSNE